MDDQTKQFLQGEAARAAEELGVNEEPKPTTEEAPAPKEPEAPEVKVEAPSAEEAPTVETPKEPAPKVEAPEDDEDDYPEIPTFVPNQLQQPQPQTPAPQPQPQAPQVPQQPAQPSAPQPQPELPQLDVRQFTDADGNVDMGKFTEAMRQRDLALVNQVSSNLTNAVAGSFQNLQATIMQEARREATNQIMAAENEKRQWERAFNKYPQLKENKELRDQVHKMRLGDLAVTGKQSTPSEIAKRYFSHIAAAREDGVKQATQTVKVQATAHLETADNTASDKGLKTQQTWDRVGDRNRRTAENARTDILKQWISDGTLKTRV